MNNHYSLGTGLYYLVVTDTSLLTKVTIKLCNTLGTSLHKRFVTGTYYENMILFLILDAKNLI